MSFRNRRHFLSWIAAATLLVGQWGCATLPPSTPPEEGKAHVGTSDQARTERGPVGVVAARFLPQAKYWAPAHISREAGRGLLKGAKTGAKVGFWPGVVVGGLAGGAAGALAGGGGAYGGAIVGGSVVGAATAGASALIAAPVGAVAAAIQAAVKAPPRAAVKKAEAELKTILADLKVQDAMRDQVVQLVRDQTQHFVLLTEHGPTAPDKKASYRSLASAGIDSVLELTVSTIELSGPWGVNPRGALVMTVRARLVRVPDDKELYARDFEYAGGSTPFTDLADNPGPLRDELERGYQSLAQTIVGELSSRPELAGSVPTH